MQDFLITHFTPPITSHIDEKNPGIVCVDSKSIQLWLFQSVHPKSPDRPDDYWRECNKNKVDFKEYEP